MDTTDPNDYVAGAPPVISEWNAALAMAQTILQELATKHQKPKRMPIEFNTSQYQFSHGRAPRGRGGWAFAPTANPRSEDIYWAPGSLTYGEAKRHARAHFAGKTWAANIVYVLP